MYYENSIADQVRDYVAGFEDDFDIEVVAKELVEKNPDAVNLDDIDYDTFLDILQRHDVSGK